MSRIRSIKPEFWTDYRLAKDHPRDERLFYIGLWNDADDEGRFLAHPRRLLGAIFPYEADLDEGWVLSAMHSLERSGRLLLYEVSGEPYGQLIKFSDHQRINKPSPSRIPSPEPTYDRTSTFREEYSPRARAPDLGSRSRELGFIGALDDAPERELDSAESGDASGQVPGREESSSADVAGQVGAVPDQGTVADQGSDVCQGAIWPESPRSAESPRKSESPANRFPAKPRQVQGRYEYPAEFEAAWSEYPARMGSNPKVGAYTAWRARAISGCDPEALATSARHYREFNLATGKDSTEFVMQASRFYGPQEVWRDYVEPKTLPSKNGASHWSESI